MATIVHFGKYYFPDEGGIENVTRTLATGAVHAGHAVTVVCFQKSAAAVTDTLDGVRIIRTPIARLIASQPLGWSYPLQCLRHGRRADVIHMHAPNMLGALCALLIGSRPKLVIHWHSDVIGKGLLGRLLKPLESLLLKRADRVVATSQIYADASPTLKPFLSKVRVVPIGVPDPQATPPPEQPLPPELSRLLHGKKLILAVGRLVPYKGFHGLIAAAQALREEAIVIIVGGGPLQEPLQNAIDAANMNHRVHLAGRLDHATLHRLFQRAHLYCLPSEERSEAFGVVLLEAMAYGLPIVATRIPGSGVPWVNQHEVSGLNVAVGDPHALAEACNRLLGSDSLHRRLSQGARERFLSTFTETMTIQRMMMLYDQLLHPDPAS
ncbi:MAG: glycosyltransferase [Magnetococcales bacterium]|nr:glycosyltransferase [Magnetococcales bacterium]